MSISQAEIAMGIALEKKSKHAADLAMQGKWNEAVEINREILSENPDNVDALNRLGKSLLETGLIKEATEAFKNALNLSPNNPIATKNLHKLIPDKKVIDKATTIEKLIDENIEDTPPINLNDGGVIKGSVEKMWNDHIIFHNQLNLFFGSS